MATIDTNRVIVDLNNKGMANDHYSRVLICLNEVVALALGFEDNGMVPCTFFTKAGMALQSNTPVKEIPDLIEVWRTLNEV